MFTTPLTAEKEDNTKRNKTGGKRINRYANRLTPLALQAGGKFLLQKNHGLSSSTNQSAPAISDVTPFFRKVFYHVTALTVSAAGLPFCAAGDPLSRHPHNRDVQCRTVRTSLSFGVVLLAVVIPGELRRYHAKMCSR